MLFSKPSKKTQKNAEENAAPEPATATEVSKPRASRSSKSKSSETSETGSVKHRKPATKAVTPQAMPAETKTMAAAAGAEQTISVASSESMAATPKSEPVAVQRAVSQEEIARLAYSYWVARGYAAGSPEEDWLRAEQEVKARL